MYRKLMLLFSLMVAERCTILGIRYVSEYTTLKTLGFLGSEESTVRFDLKFRCKGERDIMMKLLIYKKPSTDS